MNEIYTKSYIISTIIIIHKYPKNFAILKPFYLNIYSKDYLSLNNNNLNN